MSLPWGRFSWYSFGVYHGDGSLGIVLYSMQSYKPEDGGKCDGNLKIVNP